MIEMINKLIKNGYAYFEKNHEPARTTLEVSGLPLGVYVEIDMIAVI